LVGVSSTTGSNERAGVKLSYRKEFNSIGEYLFGRKKGKLKDSLDKAKDTTTGTQ
jgi:hypothetical protein